MRPKQQLPDAQLVEGEIRYGTSLWRVNQVLDDMPLDQEFSDFYAGDLRDVANISDPNDKIVKSIRDKVKSKPVGELLNLPVLDVKQLVAVARRGTRAESLPSTSST